MSLLLKAENLELAYGEIAAVRDVSFDVAEGEIVTLIGANGAGKSTTMRGIAGAMLPRRGMITFDGKDVTRMPAHARAFAGIALVPEGRRVFPALSVRENLEMGAECTPFPERLEKEMTDIGLGQVVSGVGRAMALDRDGNYDLTRKAYEAFVFGVGKTISNERL